MQLMILNVHFCTKPNFPCCASTLKESSPAITTTSTPELNSETSSFLSALYVLPHRCSPQNENWSNCVLFFALRSNVSSVRLNVERAVVIRGVNILGSISKLNLQLRRDVAE